MDPCDQGVTGSAASRKGFETMKSAAHVTIGLPDGLSDAVESAVKAGDYAAASDVIVEALKLWKAGREAPSLGDHETGALSDAGLASGPGRFASIGETISEAGQRSKPHR